MKPKSPINLRVLSYFVLALVAAALLAYAFIAPPTEVEIARVSRGRLEVTVSEDGKTRIRERYVVVSPLGGELLRVQLHAGDPVKAGETVLAVVHPSDPSLLDARAQSEAEARVRAAEARVEHAKAMADRAAASFAHAKTRHARLEQLLPTGATSRDEFDLAVHAMRTAGEDVRAGEFAIRIADYELELAKAAMTRTQSQEQSLAAGLEIRSPINGEVLRVFRESEGAVTPGAQLMELGDPTDLEMEIDVLSADAVRIPSGAKVYVEHWGSTKPLMARVRLIEPQAFLKVSALGVEEQRVNVIAYFTDAPDSRIGLGDAYRVEARIVIAEADNILMVNAGALFRRGNGWAVYRIAGGRAGLTDVKIGITSGLETEITSGLNEGDEVVAYPTDQIADGVRVVARTSSVIDAVR